MMLSLVYIVTTSDDSTYIEPKGKRARMIVMKSLVRNRKNSMVVEGRFSFENASVSVGRDCCRWTL